MRVGEITAAVYERFDGEVPVHNGEVLLDRIVLAVVEVLAEKNYVELVEEGEEE